MCIQEREGDVHTRVQCPYKEEAVCTNGCVHTRQCKKGVGVHKLQPIFYTLWTVHIDGSATLLSGHI